MAELDTRLGDPILLRKMDKLREKGISEYIPLPQLVVVGDQSSGKSSVLEGLTDLPFPRDSTLCTRFATQIIFRRAEREGFLVSIIPSSSSDTSRDAKLKSFKVEDMATLSTNDFVSVIAKACDAMGIPAPGAALTSGLSTFSDDVLRIELFGPKRSHLSVIDVPGIFRTPTEGLTTRDDISLVRRMVHRYVENPRTVILAVLPANVDIATQEILDMAADVDPSGQRTLGILTKPDLVDPGTESDVMDLVQGKKKKLHLGYCIVRNRGQQDRGVSVAERHLMETAFFDTEPWASLEGGRVGIPALSARLRDLLSRITRKEFPLVARDITNKLASREKELRDLGPRRETTEQQRRYLLDLSMQFQEITSHALEARYGRSQSLHQNHTLKLATLIVDLNSTFSEDVDQKGHTVDFGLSEEVTETAFRSKKAKRYKSRTSCDTEEDIPTVANVDHSELVAFESMCDEYPVLLEVLPSSSAFPKPRKNGINEWIEREYKASRGFELGTFDPSILPTLFQAQSNNWEALALGYISKVIHSVHRFCVVVLDSLCSDDRVKESLWAMLSERIVHRYRKTIDHVRFILLTERSGTLLTTNHDFGENLDQARGDRIRALARVRTEEFDGFGETRKPAVDETVIAQMMAVGNVEHTVRDIHDILKSYYEVARKRFVDTICKQGTDYHLVSGPDTPLRVFSSSFVVELNPGELEMIAEEDAASVHRRRSLEKEMESLREGKRIVTTWRAEV